MRYVSNGNHLKTIEEVIAGGPYETTWESLSAYEMGPKRDVFGELKESCNEKGDLRNEDLEEIRGRAYEDRGRAILGRHEKELYLRGFPFYHESGVSLCHCLEVQ